MNTIPLFYLVLCGAGDQTQLYYWAVTPAPSLPFLPVPLFPSLGVHNSSGSWLPGAHTLFLQQPPERACEHLSQVLAEAQNFL